MPKNNPALFQAIFEADKIIEGGMVKNGGKRIPVSNHPVEVETRKSNAKTKKEGDMGEPSPFDFDKLLDAVKTSIAKDTKPPRKPREKPSEEAYKRTLEILAKGRETRKANMEAKKGDASLPQNPLKEEGGGSTKAPSVEKPVEKPVEKIIEKQVEPPKPEPPKPEPPKISVSQPPPKTPVIFGKNFRANISRR
jgi:hypothetical protein